MGSLCNKESLQVPLKVLVTVASNQSSPSLTSIHRKGSSASSISSRSDTNIRSYYKIGKVLGEGQFGRVRLGTCLANSNLQVAIKTINKKKLKNPKNLKREIQILSLLDHPNIIKIYESFEETNEFHIVMELCSGRELFEYLVEMGRFQETIAAEIMTKILSAVNHMHKLGVCHRDLKLENFVGVNTENETDIKLIDFGLSTKFGKSKNSMCSVVGTPYYVAPEVLVGGYGEKCDLWSCGVMLHIMLSGKMPFNGWDKQSLLDEIAKMPIHLTGRLWYGISDDAKNLVMKLLERNPEKRLSAEEALKHHWLKSCGKIPVNLNIMESLTSFKLKSHLQKEALLMISKSLSYNQIKLLNDTFNTLDTNKDGQLSSTEIIAGLHQVGLEVIPSQVKMFLKNCDMNGDGVINYSEFIIAAMSSKDILNEDLLLATFNKFDVNKTGKISSAQLQEALIYSNSELDAECLMKELHLECSEEITYAEFKRLIKGGD